MLIFFETKDSRILSFLEETYKIKTDIIKYHLLPHLQHLNTVTKNMNMWQSKNKYTPFSYIYAIFLLDYRNVIW